MKEYTCVSRPGRMPTKNQSRNKTRRSSSTNDETSPTGEARQTVLPPYQPAMDRWQLWSRRGLLSPYIANLQLARHSSTIDPANGDHHPRPSSVEDASEIPRTRINIFHLFCLLEVWQRVRHDRVFDGARNRCCEVTWMRGDLSQAVSENDFFAPRRVDADDCRVVLVTFDIFAIVVHRPDTKNAGIVRRVRCCGQNARVAPTNNLGGMDQQQGQTGG